MIRLPFRSASRGALLCAFTVGASLSTACSADNGPVVVDGGSLFDSGFVDGAPADASSDALSDIVTPTRDTGPAVSCTVSPSPAPFANPRNVLHWRASAMTPFAGSEHVISTPVVADIVPEGPDDVASVEIAFMTWACPYQDMTMPGVQWMRQGVLRVLSTRPPYRLLWSQGGFGAVDDESAAPVLKGDAHPAVADLDGVPSNGLEIAVTATDGTLAAYRSDGSLYWRSTAFVLKNEAPVGEEMTVVNPSTSIADLEGDGVPEVVVGASVFNGRTGALLWRGSAGSGLNGQGPLSVVADLDDDGRLEVVTGRTVYESDGRPRFTLPEAGGDGFAAVGDVLDASDASGRDGVPEVIRVANGSVSIHDRATGATRWTRRLDAMTTLGGAPTVADFDGDGFAEIGVAGAAEYGVFDPGCAAGTAGCARDGVRWATPTVDSSSQITSSTVFDFNGDGTAEVVYNDENRFLVLDGRTGAVVYSNWNPSQTRTEQPIVADVTGDRRADIVFGANSCMPFAGALIPAELQATERVPGLEVWSSSDDTWVGARTVWNQHGYYVDNIGDDGTVPRRVAASWGPGGHNTFRLNRARGQLLDAPDVTGSAGASSCAGTAARVCVRVRNDGAAYAGVLRVGVYAGATASGSPAATGATTRPLAPTQSEEVCVMATVSAGTREAQFVVRVDQGGEARECREDNNDVAVTVTCGG